MNKKELVTTLIEQHRIIQADLLSALKKALTKVNGNKKMILGGILLDFQKFSKDLATHLALENGTFYVDYLSKQKQAGQNTAKTEKFIEEMNRIGKTVYAFLEKYNTIEKIEASFSDFGKELESIINILNTRIETEEEGVYQFYLMM